MRRESNYFQIGLTAFAVVAAILLFYDTLFGGDRKSTRLNSSH